VLIFLTSELIAAMMVVRDFMCYLSIGIYACLQIAPHIYIMSGVEQRSSLSWINDWTLRKSSEFTFFWIELTKASDSFYDISVLQYVKIFKESCSY
jgi:hypothetical protein